MIRKAHETSLRILRMCTWEAEIRTVPRQIARFSFARTCLSLHQKVSTLKHCDLSSAPWRTERVKHLSSSLERNLQVNNQERKCRGACKAVLCYPPNTESTQDRHLKSSLLGSASVTVYWVFLALSLSFELCCFLPTASSSNEQSIDFFSMELGVFPVRIGDKSQRPRKGVNKCLFLEESNQ